MKVKELLPILKKIDKESELSVNAFAGCDRLEHTYDITGINAWPANKKYKTPSMVFLEIGTGCFCDKFKGSRMQKLKLGPQNIDQYYLGLNTAINEVENQIKDCIHKYNQLLEFPTPEDLQKRDDYEKLELALTKILNTLKDLVKVSKTN